MSFNDTLVSAPNRVVFEAFLTREFAEGRDLDKYQYIESEDDILGDYKPVIVVNGGSHDLHVRNLVRHPSRAGLVTSVQV